MGPLNMSTKILKLIFTPIQTIKQNKGFNLASAAEILAATVDFPIPPFP
jgi:hypothetical protein